MPADVPNASVRETGPQRLATAPGLRVPLALVLLLLAILPIMVFAAATFGLEVNTRPGGAAALVGLACLLASGLAALGLSRHISETLRHIADRAGDGLPGGIRSAASGSAIRELGAHCAALDHVLAEQARHLADLERTLSETTRSEADRLACVAAIGHELRTPLNGVVGMIEAVRETEPDPERRTLLDYATRSAQTLNRLLTDLLDYARLEQRDLDLRPSAFAPRDLADELATQFRAEASHRGLAFEIGMGHDMPAALVADPDRLRQILFILVSNALHFTERGGVSVDLRFRAEEAPCIEIRVADTGVGIPEETGSKIFDAFFRDRAGIGRSQRSLGLGLSVCRGLVQRMGGSVRFDSVVGKGTVFLVTLPVGLAKTRDAASARLGERR